MLYAIDTETVIEMFPGKREVICLSWATDNDSGLVVGVDIEPWMQARLAEQAQFVLTNAAFDMVVLVTNFQSLMEPVFKAYDKNLIQCTRVRSWLHSLAQGQEEYEPKPGHSLVDQLNRYVGHVEKARVDSKSDTDSWRFRYAELKGIPLEQWPTEAVKYAIQDAKDTLTVYMAQCRVKITPRHAMGEFPSEELMCASHFASELHSTQNAFVRDFAWIRGLSEIADANVKQAQERQVAAGLARVDKKGNVIRNMAAWKEAITQAYKGNPPRNKPTEKMLEKGITVGNIRTDKKTILRTGNKDLWEMSGEGWLKVASTYLPSLQKVVYDVENKGQVIRRSLAPRYSMAVNTGRVSVFGQAPLQQFPKGLGVRESLVAEPGHAFVFTDLASSESVCLAEAYCRYLEVDTCKLLEVLESGKDVHCYTGFFIAEAAEPGKYASYEELHDAYLAGDKAAKKYRTFAKPVNHGGGGGLGPGALRDFAASYEIFLTHAEAKLVLDAWKRAFSDIQQYFDWVSQSEDFDTGRIRLPIWTTGRVRGGMSYTVACNNGFQAAAADGKRLSLFQVTREQNCRGHYEGLNWVPGEPRALFGTRLMLDMHDEFITQCRIEQVPAVAERQEHLLKAGIKAFMAHAGHAVGADSTAATRWTKNAKSTDVYYGPHDDCKGCTKPKVDCPKCWGIK